MSEGMSYAKAGVNIDVTDDAKRRMSKSVNSDDRRVLNRFGAFASLVDGSFPGYKQPVLVLKTEEPGSKQKLAFKHGYVSSIAYDLINHLIDDIVVMGAEPHYVQDCIICGSIDPATVETLVAAISAACKAQGCVLTGGETSVQPGVVEDGVYVLSASAIGVVEKDKIVDGSKIRAGDAVLAVASNGLHTNGYTLVRKLMESDAALAKKNIDGTTFFDAIMRPHTCYYQPLRPVFHGAGVNGIAHITGGGIQGNLNRILPDGCDATIDLSRIRVLPVFKAIREAGRVADAEMLRTFNMGVGLTVVCEKKSADALVKHFASHKLDAYPIGEIVKGERRVNFTGALTW